MLLLFETAAGFALFKVLKTNKLEQSEVGDNRSGWHLGSALDISLPAWH